MHFEKEATTCTSRLILTVCLTEVYASFEGRTLECQDNNCTSRHTHVLVNIRLTDYLLYLIHVTNFYDLILF